MKLVFGCIFVMACVLGGFVMHHGNLWALVVPSEYLIIGGCLIGGMIIKSPLPVLVQLARDLGQLLVAARIGPRHYSDLLKLLYELLQLARREGVLALEEHINDPLGSSVFAGHPILANRQALGFLCDTLKLFVSGILDTHSLDELMERDIEVLHHEDLETAETMTHAADSLPAIGIVAAVLGIILTMSAIDEGAAAVGRKVAGALVGTFLGVFLAYGFVGPIAGALRSRAEARERFLQCIRHVLCASFGGVTPVMAVEVGRRTIYAADRPSFEQLEQLVKGDGAHSRGPTRS